MSDVALTPKEKHQLLAVLRELDRRAPAEKRQLPRRPVVMRIRINAVAMGKVQKSQWAILHDVAASGLGLRMSSAIEKNSHFLARLKFREGGGWLVLCEVRNCTAWEDGEFIVGARLVDRIDDPDGKTRPPLDWIL